MVKKLIFTENFKKNYKKLSKDIQKQFDRKLSFFATDIKHPSLKIHRYKTEDNVWEGYISSKYRFTFSITDEGYIFRNIGPHSIIDKGRV
jgi:mRNA-degrading endonuclease RelE of RelBE toxin-antitoxin system